tara:strand:- start:2902 stop:3645 length:744 start_codon:yes stop_codon:yes gene_type:complete
MINKSISVFLPAYNEEENITAVLIAVNDYLKVRFSDYEILVISQGSTDNTNDLVRSLKSEINQLSLLTKDQCLGYAAVLRTGFANSTKELIFYTDSDCQYDIKELDKLLPLIEEYDIVTGYKYERHDPLMRLWLGMIYNTTMKLLFKLNVKDVNCAFKLYRRKVIDKIIFLPMLTEGVINAEVYVSALSNGYTIGEVGVHHYARTKGQGAELGKRGKIIAFVNPLLIIRALRDTLALFNKVYIKRKP